MKNLKKLVVGFALVAGATGAYAADKQSGHCFKDEVSFSSQTICTKAIVNDGNTSRLMTGVTVKNDKTGQVCKADKGRVLLDAQGKQLGYIISSPKCSK
jgi:hypothetical protein